MAACAVSLAAASAAQAIVFRDDMTDALSDGLARQSQFSGVGKVGAGGGSGTGTLILSDWVLTAKQVVAGSATATFKGITGTVYADPDPNSDLALIRLSTTPGGAAISPGFVGSESGRLSWLVGVGGYGTVANSGNNGSGLNYSGIPHAGTNVVRESSGPYLYSDNANTAAASSVYEAGAAPGDAGGPLFQQVNNVWTVVGVSSGITANGFVHTPTSAHQSFILTAIRTATGNSTFNFATPTAPKAFLWDANPALTGLNEGNGTWDAQRPNFQSNTTFYNYAWDNAAASDVTFGTGGLGGTVTIGATNVASGTKIDGTAGPVVSAGGVVAHNLTFGVLNAGQYTIAATGAATLTLVNNGSTNPTITTNANAEISAPIASGANITKAGVRTLILSGSNTYTGTLLVSAGTLVAKSPAALPGYATPGRLSVFNRAWLSLPVGGQNDWSAAQVNAVLTAHAMGNGSTLALDTTNGDFTYTDAVSGSIGLGKTGVNTLTLTTLQTYSGDTTVSGGALVLSGAGRLPNTAVVLGSGAMLKLGSGVTQTISAVLANNAVAASVSGPGTLKVSTGQVGGGANSTVDLTDLPGFTVDAANGLQVNGSAFVAKLPANTISPNGLTVGTGDYNSVTSTTTTATLGGDTTIGNVQVGNYHASGVLSAAPAAAGKTLTLRGLTNGRVSVGVGVNTAATQSQSGVFDTSGMLLDAFVGTMRVGDYRPESGTATTSGTFTMTGGSLDAQSITLGYVATTGAGMVAGGTTSGTFNQLGGRVTVNTLLLGQVASSNTYGATQTAIYTLGSAAAPATLIAGAISAGKITSDYNTFTATRTLNFVNGRITPTPGTSLFVNDFAGGVTNVAGKQALTVVLSPTGTHALTAPAGRAIGFNSTVTLSGSGGLTVDGAGTVVLSSTNTFTGGTRVTSGILGIGPSRTPFLTGNGLNIEGGRVNFDYVNQSNNPAATIRSLLAASYRDNGFVNGRPLRSATAAAARGLAYVDNGMNTFSVLPAFYGDADLDGGVSINDFNTLAGNFGEATGKVWIDGDFDYDGGISINDFNLLASTFGQTIAGSAVGVDYSGMLGFAAAHDDLAAFEAVTGVPEPACVGVLVMNLAIVRRRRAATSIADDPAQFNNRSMGTRRTTARTRRDSTSV